MNSVAIPAGATPSTRQRRSRRVRVISVIAIGMVALAVGAYTVGRVMISARESDKPDGLPAGIPGRLIVVDGRRVHIVEQGTGAPLLLVHGTAGTTLDWESTVLDRLAEEHRAIAVDLFGMGFSERSDEFSYGFRLWSDQLTGTLDTLGIERASVIGHSLGGAIAAVFAANHPTRVDHLVSVDSGPWLPPFMLMMITPGSGELLLGSSEYWPDRPDAKGPYAERMRQVYAMRGTRQGLLRAVRGQLFESGQYFGAFPRISCPTLFVHGGADEIIPYRAAAALVRLVPNSRIVTIEGAGHFVMNDQPERFLDAVQGFLRAPSS